MYKRRHFHALALKLAEPRTVILVFAGPRQVGKTTLVGQLLASSNTPAHSVSADGMSATSAGWLDQQWEVARLPLNPNPQTTS